MKQIKFFKKLSKIFAIIVFLFSFEAEATVNVAITNWRENTQLNLSGKTSEIFIHGKVSNLAKNQVMQSFSIGFDKKRKLTITKTLCDGKPANYSFNNNVLSVKFLQEKQNNETISFYFAYEEKYDEINQFLRQEAIDIPIFAQGAIAKVIINFPGYLESATLNPNITKSDNSFIYNNIVPKNGVQEIIKLTEAQRFWNVSLKTKINTSVPLRNLKVTIPTYFQNGGQKVENLITAASVIPSQQIAISGGKTLKFDGMIKELIIENRAKISTGQNNRTQITRNPDEYLKVSAEEEFLLAPILEKIRQSSKNNNLPLYAKIGMFVNEFIRYDESYIGKLPSLKEVLQNPVGVCTEYSKLYNALARLAKIPSISIVGAACGEYNKCQGHAWNMIYYDNQWIDVDATWNLMSGIVSSSHVYFSDSGRDRTNIEYLTESGKELPQINSKMDFEMTKAL